MTTVTVTNMAELQRMLSKISGEGLKQAVQTAALKLAERAKPIMQRYPGPSHSPVLWSSPRQRAWWFATRRERGLPLEYTRLTDPMSKQLKYSWEVAALSNGAVLGTRMDGAEYVQSSKTQWGQHTATGWGTDEDAVKELERTGVMQAVVTAEIDSMVKRMLK